MGIDDNKITVMKKITVFFLVLFFLSSVASISLARSNVTTEDKTKAVVNSYELFWPIVPGKVMGDKLYSLKLFKEKLRESIIFSSFKKADYLVTISEKRLVESEFLYKNGDVKAGAETLSLAAKTWSRIRDLISQTKSSGTNVANLQTRFASSLEKQSLVLDDLLIKLQDEQVGEIKASIDKAKELLSELN